ncbi:MAG: ABC transporter ATP-binding protein [Archangiaceae bacterium]|nr:ABC transporter ATP-binding protein [Archangiaceae bacterium]
MSTPAPRSALRRFFEYVWPYAGLMWLATLAGMLKFVLPSTTALALKFLTDRLVPTMSGGQPQGKSDVVVRAIDALLFNFSHLLPAGWEGPWGRFNLLMIFLIAIYALWAVSTYYRSYWAAVAGHRTMLDLRTDLYAHLTRLSHGFFASRQSGSIVSRLMADIALAQNFVGTAMTNIWMDLVSCVFYVYVLFSMDAPLAAAALVVFPFYIVSMRGFGKLTKQSTHDLQQAMETFSGDVQERIGGIQMVKSYTAEQREVRAFFGGARRLYDLTMRNAIFTSLSNSVVQWLTQMATVGIIWFGGYRLVTGQTSVGTVVAFILLLRELYFPISRMSELNAVLQNSLAAIERIFEIFDVEPDVKELPDARELPTPRGAVSLENVTFGYGEAAVLRDLSLEVKPGEVVALVGPSGAGKSTLIQLVPRFYDPRQGTVRVDGVDVRELKLRPLRAMVGMVAQDTLLLSGSVRENILYGRPSATEAEVLAAARAAHAHEFITALPQGYETELGERGTRLSGGQKQRIALARAFLKDPKILILDEATSALDSESEALIQQSLDALMKGRTCIAIAHRLSTIVHADRIVVMEAGKIVEVGPHAELLRRGGLYARLYQRQFGLTERAAADVRPG